MNRLTLKGGGLTVDTFGVLFKKAVTAIGNRKVTVNRSENTMDVEVLERGLMVKTMFPSF